MRVVLFNGPPGSGKDQAVKFLTHINPEIRHFKFRTPLDRAIQASFDIPYSCDEAESKFGIDATGKRWKDQAQGVMFGAVPRKVYQAYSTWIKEMFGDDILGRLAVNKLLETHADMCVFSDCGFVEEVEAVVNHVGKSKCLIVQIMRKGCTFEGDTRSYIEIPGVDMIEINNRHELFMYKLQVIRAVYTWAGYTLPASMFYGD